MFLLIERRVGEFYAAAQRASAGSHSRESTVAATALAKSCDYQKLKAAA
jgi:hypothetical protein